MSDPKSAAYGLQVAERHRVEYPGMWLRLPCCEGSVHPVRIESQHDGLIVISAPDEPHPAWIKQPDANTPVTLGWTDTGGTLILNCVVPEDGARTETWSLRVLSTQDFLQRRRHVRVSSDATVQLIDGDMSRVISGKVLDVSESGMRCLFEEFIPDQTGRPFQFALHLEDVSVVVTCVLRWTGRTGPLDVQAGFEFVAAYDSLLTRLRSYVMMRLGTIGPLDE